MKIHLLGHAFQKAFLISTCSLIVFVCLPANAVNAQAGTLIYANDFDAGSWGSIGHGPTGGSENGTSLTMENPHSGAFAAKVDYSIGNLNHIWFDGLQDSIDRDLYVSFWFYHHPDWEFHYNHKLMRLTDSWGSRFPTNHEFLAGDTFFSDGSILVTPSTDCGYSDNSWYSVPTSLTQPGQWHRFEFYGKLNTNGNDDGVFRLWIDGEQVEDNTMWSWMDPGCDPQSTTYKWGTVFFPSNYADTPPVGSTPIYYVDDIEIWDGMPADTGQQSLVYACSDGADNDSDGLTDYPADPGCSSATDNDEYNAPTITTCTSFTYSSWGACQSSNTQLRSVISSSPSGCTGGMPITTQSCTYTSSSSGGSSGGSSSGGSSSSSGSSSSGGSSSATSNDSNTTNTSTTQSSNDTITSSNTTTSTTWVHTRTYGSDTGGVVSNTIRNSYGSPYFTYHGVNASLLKVYHNNGLIILTAGSGSTLQSISPTARLYTNKTWHTIPLTGIWPANTDGTFTGKAYYILRTADVLYDTEGAFTAHMKMNLPGCDNDTCNVDDTLLQEYRMGE